MTPRPDQTAELVADFAEACKPKINDLVRAGADAAYLAIMEAVQEYLTDNAQFNIGAQLDAANREARDLRQEAAAYRDVLETARDRFFEYARLHGRKGTPDGDAKAERNRDLAMAISAVLENRGAA